MPERSNALEGADDHENVRRTRGGGACCHLCRRSFAETLTDTAKHVDAKKRTITLTSGETFHLPRDYNMSRIENGEIKINYRKKGDQMQATEVVAAR